MILFVSAIQKDEMGGVCGTDTCGRENIRARYFGWKN